MVGKLRNWSAEDNRCPDWRNYLAAVGTATLELTCWPDGRWSGHVFADGGARDVGVGANLTTAEVRSLFRQFEATGAQPEEERDEEIDDGPHRCRGCENVVRFENELCDQCA